MTAYELTNVILKLLFCIIIVLLTIWWCSFIYRRLGCKSEKKLIKNNSPDNNIFNTTCVHEAGHALMYYLLGIENYEILMLVDQCCYIKSKKVISSQIDLKCAVLVDYAGACAEEIMHGNYSYGCLGGENSDFKIATEQIRNYIIMTTCYKSKTGLEKEINEQVIEYSKQFYKEAYDMLYKNQSKLEKIIKLLQTKGYGSVTTSSEINKLFKITREDLAVGIPKSEKN